MASGRMDLILSSIPANVVYMTMNSLGSADRGLAAIDPGTEVTLRHGSIRQTVAVHYRPEGESFVNFMELSPQLARKLKLNPSRRYKLDYNASGKLLAISPAPVSNARAVIRSAAKLSSRSVYIGYALRSALGIPEQRGLNIILRRGTLRRQLAVHTPGNLFDQGFRLSPAVARAFRLAHDARLQLTYDQASRTLDITAAANEQPQQPRKPSADTQTGDA